MALKTMPNNIEAEESVLGACFLSKYALEKACESLTEDSFYNEKNAKITDKLTDIIIHIGNRYAGKKMVERGMCLSDIPPFIQ